MADPLAGRLRGILGPQGVVDDPEQLVAYETDWMGRRPGRARLVARPASTREVAMVVDACRDADAPVVPQGGNTGLVGGGVPRDGEVVLSTRRLDWVGDVDPLTGTLAAGAGAPLAAVRDAARHAGFDVGVDLGARDSATVGGMAATNAGGLRVIRHGHMRAHLAGLEAVTADGQVISRMAGLVKDTAGYDLTGLLCGSEGTLAVITAVLLRLVPATPARVTAVVGLASLGHAMDLLAGLRRRLPELEAAEVVLADGVALVEELFGVAPAVDRSWRCQLLLEVAGPEEAALVDRLADALGAAGRSAGDDGSTAVAVDPAGRSALWEIRERHPEVVVRLGAPHKLDVSLPLGRLADFEREVRARLAAAVPRATAVLYGHAGDGGLHVNVAMPEDDGGDGDPAERIDEVVLDLVGTMGGSVSAEHGIGTDKVRWVGLTRSPVEMRAMRAVKDALDPAGLLNPGVLFSPRR